MVTHLIIVMKETNIFGEVSEKEFNKFIIKWLDFVIQKYNNNPKENPTNL